MEQVGEQAFGPPDVADTCLSIDDGRYMHNLTEMEWLSPSIVLTVVFLNECQFI